MCLTRFLDLTSETTFCFFLHNEIIVRICFTVNVFTPMLLHGYGTMASQYYGMQSRQKSADLCRRTHYVIV